MANPSGTELTAPWRAARKRSPARIIMLRPDGSVEVRSSPAAPSGGPILRLQADGSVDVDRARRRHERAARPLLPAA